MKLSNVLTAMFATVLALVLADQGLRLPDYSTTREIQVTHPKNFHRTMNNLEFRYEFQTNSLGLRYEELPEAKADHETRFLILGDSMTEGYGVETNETFSAQLQEAFSRAEGRPIRFINGGLTGVGPLEYWRLFYAIGLELAPDVILVCVTYNDVSSMAPDLSIEDIYNFKHHDYSNQSAPLQLFYALFPRLYTLISHSTERIQQAWERWSAPESFVDRVAKVAEEKDIPDERIRQWRASLDPGLVEANNNGLVGGLILSLPLINPDLFKVSIDLAGEDAEAKFGSLVLVLDEIRRTSEDNDIAVGLIYIPTRFQYEQDVFNLDHPWVEAGLARREWLTETTEIQSRLGRWATAHGVPYLDLTASLRNEAIRGETLTFELDGHWNANGHHAAASAIREWIEEESLLDPRLNELARNR